MAEKKGSPQVDAMSEEDMARFYDEHQGDTSLWDKEPRRIRARRGPSTVFQMRIDPAELEEIARAADGNVSDFVRKAALEKARRQADKSGALEAVRRQARELAEAVEQL